MPGSPFLGSLSALHIPGFLPGIAAPKLGLLDRSENSDPQFRDPRRGCPEQIHGKNRDFVEQEWRVMHLVSVIPGGGEPQRPVTLDARAIWRERIKTNKTLNQNRLRPDAASALLDTPR